MRTSYLSLLCCLVLLDGCLRIEGPYEIDNGQEVTIEDTIEPRNDSLYNRALDVMRYNANLISSVRWIPLRTFYNEKGNYVPGKTYRGIPYSSAKEKDKFVGLDVSFYTYLSSVNNPHSVFYSERIDEVPYHGINCSTYYGTTCSSSVSFALGLGNQIPSADFQNSPLFIKPENQTVDVLEAGDVLASSGHSILILDVMRDSQDAVSEVDVLEIIRVYKMSREELEEFKGEKYSIFRYKYLQRNQESEQIPFDFHSPNAAAEFFMNFALCPSRGDKATYANGEAVTINVLKAGYDELVLWEDGKRLQTYSLAGSDNVVLNDLGPGYYTVNLKNNSDISGMVSFEILDTQVSVRRRDKNSITVTYDSRNGAPHSIVICNINGKQRLVYFLSKNEVQSGYANLKYANSANEQLYCKVLFQGQYGKVSNSPIPL